MGSMMKYTEKEEIQQRKSARANMKGIAKDTCTASSMGLSYGMMKAGLPAVTMIHESGYAYITDSSFKRAFATHAAQKHPRAYIKKPVSRG